MIAQDSFYTVGAVYETPTQNNMYIADNNTVWELMQQIYKNSPCWTIICPYQNSRDRWNAFVSLYTNYLGAMKVDNLV